MNNRNAPVQWMDDAAERAIDRAEGGCQHEIEPKMLRDTLKKTIREEIELALTDKAGG